VRLGPFGSPNGRERFDKEANMSQLLQTDPVVDEGTAHLSTAAPAAPPKNATPYPREEADPATDLSPRDRRALRLHEARTAARELHNAPDFRDRLEIYNRWGVGMIRLAAANFPFLMPMLNGEFEFLELTRADHS
jgi:hypothetical protein